LKTKSDEIELLTNAFAVCSSRADIVGQERLSLEASQFIRVLTVNCLDSMQHRVTPSELDIIYGQDFHADWLAN
jgi:hypothetical protein